MGQGVDAGIESEKLERDAERRTGEKLEAMKWFMHACVGVWNKSGATEQEQERTAGGAVKGVQAQQQDTDQAAAKWRAQVHARVQGLGHAMGMIQQHRQTSHAWEVGMEAELKRQEANYLMEQERERETVQEQRREWDKDKDEDEDEDTDEDEDKE